ncbi:hypothetical protein J6590_094978 [Homalodisca vitripennis]|nr:hypothetical protein J6590_094978 [Homalodisca vitripennis]
MLHRLQFQFDIDVLFFLGPIMAERTRKIMIMASMMMDEEEQLNTENNGLMNNFEGQTNESGAEDPQPPILPNALNAVNEFTTDNPQPTTSQVHSSVKQQTERSDWVVGYTSSTKVNLRRVESRKYFPSPASDSEKLFSSDSSDDYEPSSSEESSIDNSNAPLVSIRPNDNTEVNDETESINVTKKGKKRTRRVNDWKRVKHKLLKNSGQSYTSRTGKTVDARKMGPTIVERNVFFLFQRD